MKVFYLSLIYLLSFTLISAQDLKVQPHTVIRSSDGGQRVCYFSNNSEDVKNVIASKSNLLSNGTIEIGKISIYPNPVSDYLKFRVEDNTFSSISVQIISLLGEKVLEAEITEGEELDVSKLTKGGYVVKLYTDKQLLYTDFIIKK